MNLEHNSCKEVNYMKSSLTGRLQRFNISSKKILMPLYEAVINSIEAILESGKSVSEGSITIDIFRKNQAAVVEDEQVRSEITDITIMDSGIGFTDDNMEAFETLDSTHKIVSGGKGVGRLAWLKVFSNAGVESVFEKGGRFYKRTFSFDSEREISNLMCEELPEARTSYTIVSLNGCRDMYQINKPIEDIAAEVSEHCLLPRIGQELPNVVIREGTSALSVNSILTDKAIMESIDEEMAVKGEQFSVRHLKFKSRKKMEPKIVLLGNGRTVETRSISSIIPALKGKIVTKKDEEFDYICLVSGAYLDAHIRADRTGFDLPENCSGDILELEVISLSDVVNGVAVRIKAFLAEAIKEKTEITMENVNRFVNNKAPRYKLLMKRVGGDVQLAPDASDAQIDRYLHGKMFEFETEILERGDKLLQCEELESEEFRQQMNDFVADVDELKQADLAAYVGHRYSVIALLKKLLERRADGKYAYEREIHSLIMPMRCEGGDDKAYAANLWLIDERLAFNDYIASDIPIGDIPVFTVDGTERPDIIAERFYENPFVVSERDHAPFSDGVTIIEFKRPMRQDLSGGNDPVEQALSYLKQIRKGGVVMKNGRPLRVDTQGKCMIYVICDITQGLQEHYLSKDYVKAPDGESLYKHFEYVNADVEVMSLDALVNRARERNYSFFSRLGLPTL